MFGKQNHLMLISSVVAVLMLSGCSSYKQSVISATPGEECQVGNRGKLPECSSYKQPVISAIPGKVCPVDNLGSVLPLVHGDVKYHWYLTKEEKKTEQKSKQNYVECIYSAVKYDPHTDGNPYSIINSSDPIYIFEGRPTFDYDAMISRMITISTEKEREAYYSSPAGKAEIKAEIKHKEEEQKRKEEVLAKQNEITFSVCELTSKDVEEKYNIGHFSGLINYYKGYYPYSGDDLYFCIARYTWKTVYGEVRHIFLTITVNGSTGMYEIDN